MFSLDGKFYLTLNKISEIVVLNFWFIICCLPVITIGASMNAMYAVSIRLVKKEGGSSVTREFFRFFKENFKQSTGIFFIMLAYYAVIGLDIYILEQMQLSSAMRLMFYGLLLMAGLLVSFVLLYALGLISIFDNTVRNTLRNAFLLSLQNAPASLLMVLIAFSPFLCMYFLPKYLASEILFALFFWFSGGAYLNSFLLWRIFKKLIPEEEADELQEEKE